MSMTNYASCDATEECAWFSETCAFFLSRFAKKPARSVPEIECHTQETAQMTADSGVLENCAEVVARLVARPAFCIPTSMEMVRFLAVFIPVILPVL